MQIDTDRLLKIFFDLVKIDAVSRFEKPVADYIRGFLRRMQIDCIEDLAGKQCNGNSGNLIGYYGEKGQSPPFALVAHMDTVKPTSGISPILMNKRIVTDGSTILGADNRAGIAIILYVIEHLKKNKIRAQPFEFMFTIGEETGFYGSVNLDLDLLRSKISYVLDSSANPGAFVYSAPGAVGIQCEIKGKASHAAVHPEEGVNALRIAAELLHDFPIGQVDDETTINFGTITGGEANNIVPAQILLTGEVRSFSNEKIEYYFGLLNNSLKKISGNFGGTFCIDKKMSFPGFVLDLESHAVKQLTAAMYKTGLKPEPLRYHGGSDANILNNRGISAVNLGIGAKNPHSVNEYIEIDSLISVINLCFSLLGAAESNCTEVS